MPWLHRLLLVMLVVIAAGHEHPVTALEAPVGFDAVNIELGTSVPLLAPMKMTISPDGRLFVCEQAGRIRVILNDILLDTPLLTILNVETYGDDGLQAIALDPDFATTGQPGSGRFFTYHHYLGGGYGRGRVSIYRLSADNPNVAVATPEAVLDLDPMVADGGGRPGSHVGATLAMGRDGMLYLAVGMQDASAESQSWSHSASKILRLRPEDLGPAPGNPFEFSGSNAMEKRVWGRGARNPFSLSVDPVTGMMIFDDVGSNHIVTPNADHHAWEESNHVPNPGEASFAGGAPFDFGWPTTEGTGPHLVHVYENGAANENSGGRDCAKIGGTFYRPTTVTFPAFYLGAYFFADFCSTYIKYLPVEQQSPTTGGDAVPTNVASMFMPSTGVAITDLETHPNGSLYLLGRSTPERKSSAVGLLYRIFTSGPVPSVAVTSPEDGARLTTGQSVGGLVDVPVTVAASDANGGLSLVEVLVDDNVVGSCAGSPCTVVIPGLGRGTYTLQGRAINVLGNRKISEAVSVTVDGPNATISSPAVGATFQAGIPFTFSGQATNADGSPLSNASAFTWSIYLNHGTHQHLEGIYPGVTSGVFTLSSNAETDPDISVGIHLTVTDAFGVSVATSRTLTPLTTTVTLDTTPVAGLAVKVDSAFWVSPYGFTSVAGMTRTIGAPLKQKLDSNGHWYAFQSWSDGGAYQHTLTTPATDITYTAAFRDATGTGTGLYGEYFSNASLTGLACETNERIDQDWGRGAPPCGNLPADGFSVRWTGQLQPYFTEDHTFYVEADGGVRLWVNNRLLIDSWAESLSERASPVLSLNGGSLYDIKLEYQDTTGAARVRLYWATSGVLKEIIPTSQLQPSIARNRTAVFVVGSTPLNASDKAIMSRLQGLGFAVTATLDSASATGDANNVHVVVISETCISTRVADKFLSVEKPVLVLEPAILDDMRMTEGTDMGTVTGTMITVQPAAGALAAGLSGDTTVVTAPSIFIWGIPATSATVVAKVMSSTSTQRATIFTYEKGATLVSGFATGKRGAFFDHGDTAASHNSNGWALFDALVAWAAPDSAVVEPTPVLIREVRLTPLGCLRVTWDSPVGRRYQVETTAQLNPASWAPAGPEILSQGPTTVGGDCPGELAPVRFYRIRPLP